MKLLRAINVLLLCATLAGLFLLVGEKRRQRPLFEDARRLHLLLGDLEVEDAEKVYIRAIPTGSPLSFSWSVYLPKGYVPSASAVVAGSNHRNYPRQRVCAPLSEPSQFVLRMNLFGGKRTVRSSFGGGGHRHLSGGVESWILPDNDEEHSAGAALTQPERLDIRQLGIDQTVAFTKDDDIELLKIVQPRPEKKKNFVVCEYRLASGTYVESPARESAWEAREVEGGTDEQ